ncbi:cupin domain-containing protein [Thermoflexus hugenholtzii]
MIFRASIPEIRELLQKPFQVYPVARLGGVQVYVYRSHGEVQKHRHPEFDEVFMVYEGLVTFGIGGEEFTLRPDELLWIPRGMAHWSGSRLPSMVLLFRRDEEPLRWNGDFRIREGPGERPVIVRIHEALQDAPPGSSRFLLEASGVRYLAVRTREGSTEWEARGPALLLLLRGELALEGEGPGFPEPTRGILAPGELAVLPPGTRGRWESERPAVLLWAENVEHI